uniref:SPRY-associated domain-containing protein n=1 Tax=Astyanax mexicanus TaxID=7994 RepID=A0A3B1J4N9_ASTMX
TKCSLIFIINKQITWTEILVYRISLINCSLTDECCAALASALSSKFLRLTFLNLSANYLGDSGVKLLSSGLENPNCKLEALCLQRCNLTKESCTVLASALSSSSSTLKRLDLSKNELQDSGVKLLSTGLENPHCKLEKLELKRCNLTEESCDVLASALSSNSSNLKELDLSNNELLDLGVKLLYHYTLTAYTLNTHLIYCCVYAFVKISNPVIELSLVYNKPGDSGVKELSNLLYDGQCKLEQLE